MPTKKSKALMVKTTKIEPKKQLMVKTTKMAQTKMSPTKMSPDKQKISYGKNMPGSTPLKANASKYKTEANKRASKALQLMRKKNK